MEKVVIALLALLLVSACGYSNLKTKEEQTKVAWNDLGFSCRQRTEIASLYLEALHRHVPSKNAVVQQAEQVIKKAALEGCPRTVPDSPEKLLRFRQAQTELTQTLAHLHVCTDDYPSLLEDERYRAIQRRVELAENRFNEAIADYNLASHDFNVSKRSFPHSVTNFLLLRYRDKEPFLAEEDVKLSGRFDS